jgi:hypothetical protein
MDVAVPMVMIQHYLNPCLHYLIGPALVTLVMWHLDDAVEITRGKYYRHHRQLLERAGWGRTLLWSRLRSIWHKNIAANFL